MNMHFALRLLASVTGFFSTLLSVAVAVQLWKWFAVNPYALPPVSIPILFGLLLGYKVLTTDVAAILLRIKNLDDDELTAVSWATIPHRIAIALIALGIGWILTHFM